MVNYSRTHYLNLDERYFENIKSGRKRFEIRKDDRDYQVGDFIQFRCGETSIQYEIIYKTTFEQKEGYCVLGIDNPRYLDF
jgi:ASC-1-like (ASCH) protein